MHILCLLRQLRQRAVIREDQRVEAGSWPGTNAERDPQSGWLGSLMILDLDTSTPPGKVPGIGAHSVFGGTYIGR